MRTQIALAALVAFAAAQDESASLEEAMAAAIEQALAQMTDEERAAFEAAQAATEDLNELNGDLGEMVEQAEEMAASGGDVWDGNDMMDSKEEGAWSPDIEELVQALDVAFIALQEAQGALYEKEGTLLGLRQELEEAQTSGDLSAEEFEELRAEIDTAQEQVDEALQELQTKELSFQLAQTAYFEMYDQYYGDGDKWFGFGEEDLSLDTLEDLDIDVSECEGLDDNVDEDALKDCLKAIEAGIKGLDISKLTEEAWRDFKEEEENRDWEEAVEVAQQLGVELGKLADDLVTDVASTLEAQVEDSALIDADAWYAVYEDLISGAFDDMDMSAAEKQFVAMASISDEFIEALEDNEKIGDAVDELDKLVGNDFDGTAIEALEGDEAVTEAFEAIMEADEISEAQLDALTKAIADSEVAGDEIEKVLAQATIIADEVISEVETTVEDVFTENIPALMDAVKDAMPDSVDSMVDDAWSEVGETIEKVSGSGSASAVRSALEEQLAEVQEIVGSEALTSIIDKAERLGETVSSAATELTEEPSA